MEGARRWTCVTGVAGALGVGTGSAAGPVAACLSLLLSRFLRAPVCPCARSPQACRRSSASCASRRALLPGSVSWRSWCPRASTGRPAWRWRCCTTTAPTRSSCCCRGLACGCPSSRARGWSSALTSWRRPTTRGARWWWTWSSSTTRSTATPGAACWKRHRRPWPCWAWRWSARASTRTRCPPSRTLCASKAAMGPPARWWQGKARRRVS